MSTTATTATQDSTVDALDRGEGVATCSSAAGTGTP